ncbi:MAG: ABC transporter permease [Mycobacteriales bacterium]
MSPTITMATARRVLTQLRHDRRTMAMLLLLPAVLMVLLRYVFDSKPVFNHVAPSLLGLFPFTVMFLVTSVATLRERTSGTLERLMTTPMNKVDLLLGYGIAFGVVAVVQVAVVAAITVTWLGLDIAGSIWILLLVAVVDALYGTASGLFVSAFARSEFQAVQFLPVVVMPQVLLCGLFTARGHMARLLEWVSDVMPLSYAVDAMNRVTASSTVGGKVWRDVAILGGVAVFALIAGAATLRRRTP